METVKSKKKGRFSLIEYLMLLMLVGIVFTFIVPLREDLVNHEKAKEAIRDLQIISRANVAFQQDPESFGFYAFDLRQLNIDHLIELHYFNYELTDSMVVAVTTEEFGRKGAKIYYYLPNGPMQVADDRLSRELINPNWLP